MILEGAIDVGVIHQVVFLDFSNQRANKRIKASAYQRLLISIMITHDWNGLNVERKRDVSYLFLNSNEVWFRRSERWSGSYLLCCCETVRSLRSWRIESTCECIGRFIGTVKVSCVQADLVRVVNWVQELLFVYISVSHFSSSEEELMSSHGCYLSWSKRILNACEVKLLLVLCSSRAMSGEVHYI